MQKSEIITKAIPYFTTKGYQVQTQTDMLLIFISEKKEVNWVVFLVACCFGILPGIIYYYVFCPRHQVTISITGDQEAQAMLNGTTEESRKDAMEFQKLLQ